MASNAAANWELLRAGGHSGGGLEVPTVPTDVSTVRGPVRLAVGAKGEPRLLLPLARRETLTSIVTYTIDLSVAGEFRCQTAEYRDLEARLCP